jgi:hypothetical protein
MYTFQLCLNYLLYKPKSSKPKISRTPTELPWWYRSCRGRGSLEEQSSQTGLHTDTVPLHHEQLLPTEREICFKEIHINICLHRTVDEMHNCKFQTQEIYVTDSVKSCFGLYMCTVNTWNANKFKGILVKKHRHRNENWTIWYIIWLSFCDKQLTLYRCSKRTLWLAA